MILGCNGLIWVAPTANFTTDAEEIVQDTSSSTPTASGGAVSDNTPPVPKDTREAVCRVTNSIRCLSALNLAIHLSTIMSVYKVRSTELSLIASLSTLMQGGD